MKFNRPVSSFLIQPSTTNSNNHFDHEVDVTKNETQSTISPPPPSSTVFRPSVNHQSKDADLNTALHLNALYRSLPHHRLDRQHNQQRQHSSLFTSADTRDVDYSNDDQQEAATSQRTINPTTTTTATATATTSGAAVVANTQQEYFDQLVNIAEREAKDRNRMMSGDRGEDNLLIARNIPRHKLQRIEQSNQNVSQIIQKLSVSDDVRMDEQVVQRGIHGRFLNRNTRAGDGGDDSDYANYFQSNKQLDDMMMMSMTPDQDEEESDASRMNNRDDGTRASSPLKSGSDDRRKIGGVHIVNPQDNRQQWHRGGEKVAIASPGSNHSREDSIPAERTNMDQSSTATTTKDSMGNDAVDDLLRENNLQSNGDSLFDDDDLLSDRSSISNRMNMNRDPNRHTGNPDTRIQRINSDRSTPPMNTHHNDSSFVGWLLEFIRHLWGVFKDTWTQHIIPIVKRFLMRVRYINPYMRAQFRNRQQALTSRSFADNQVQSITSYKNYGLLSNAQVFYPPKRSLPTPTKRSKSSTTRIAYEQVN